jgi:hypothetical protein
MLCCPDLVCIRPGVYIFRADDRYYAVPHMQFHQFLAGDRSRCCRGSDTCLADLLEQVDQWNRKKSRQN